MSNPRWRTGYQRVWRRNSLVRQLTRERNAQAQWPSSQIQPPVDCCIQRPGTHVVRPAAGAHIGRAARTISCCRAPNAPAARPRPRPAAAAAPARCAAAVAARVRLARTCRAGRGRSPARRVARASAHSRRARQKPADLIDQTLGRCIFSRRMPIDPDATPDRSLDPLSGSHTACGDGRPTILTLLPTPTRAVPDPMTLAASTQHALARDGGADRLNVRRRGAPEGATRTVDGAGTPLAKTGTAGERLMWRRRTEETSSHEGCDNINQDPGKYASACRHPDCSSAAQEDPVGTGRDLGLDGSGDDHIARGHAKGCCSTWSSKSMPRVMDLSACTRRPHRRRPPLQSLRHADHWRALEVAAGQHFSLTEARWTDQSNQRAERPRPNLHRGLDLYAGYLSGILQRLERDGLLARSYQRPTGGKPRRRDGSWRACLRPTGPDGHAKKSGGSWLLCQKRRGDSCEGDGNDLVVARLRDCRSGPGRRARDRPGDTAW